MGGEKAETYLLAGVGAVQGLWRYYIRPEISSKRSWALLAGFVALHDYLCPEGETLSEGVDRSLERSPFITQAAIGITALHLANLLPKEIDPYHAINQLIRGSNEAPSDT